MQIKFVAEPPGFFENACQDNRENVPGRTYFVSTGRNGPMTQGLTNILVKLSVIAPGPLLGGRHIFGYFIPADLFGNLFAVLNRSSTIFGGIQLGK